MTDVAMVDSSIDNGHGGFNHAAVALLTGYPPSEVRKWMDHGRMPAEAARDGRRRAKEAMAAVGRQLDGLSALIYFAVQEGADLQLDGKWLVHSGRYVGPAT